MLLGNTNVNYDPDHHLTDKNPTCFDKGLSRHRSRQLERISIVLKHGWLSENFDLQGSVSLMSETIQ